MSQLFMVLLILFILPAKADIFGRDDRFEVFPFAKPAYQTLSRSVAVGVLASLWSDQGEYLELNAEPLSDYMCADERFVSQKSIAYACSGFLVGEDLLVTAGHCGVNIGETQNSEDNYCDVYTWMFDYYENSNTKRVKKNQIYRCKKIIYAIKEAGDFGKDFALIRLDRKVEGREPLKLASTDSRKGDSLSMLGFPMGLPMKYTHRAYVLKSKNKEDYFFSDLDAFAGNSGSPVFNTWQEVVGILVGGNPSLSTYKDGACHRYNRCDSRGKNCKSSNHGPKEEGFPKTYSKVQKIFRIKDLLKKI